MGTVLMSLKREILFSVNHAVSELEEDNCKLHEKQELSLVYIVKVDRGCGAL